MIAKKSTNIYRSQMSFLINVWVLCAVEETLIHNPKTSPQFWGKPVITRLKPGTMQKHAEIMRDNECAVRKLQEYTLKGSKLSAALSVSRQNKTIHAQLWKPSKCYPKK